MAHEALESSPVLDCKYAAQMKCEYHQRVISSIRNSELTLHSALQQHRGHSLLFQTFTEYTSAGHCRRRHREECASPELHFVREFNVKLFLTALRQATCRALAPFTQVSERVDAATLTEDPCVIFLTLVFSYSYPTASSAVWRSRFYTQRRHQKPNSKLRLVWL
ncbi:uncharacterized [Tachysurus ichikawai]